MTTVDLNNIVLKLKWVNGQADKTNRSVTLYQIINMDYEQRKNLFWIDDFHPKVFSNMERKDELVKINEFNIDASGIGYIHWVNTTGTGLFYEATYETLNEDEFNAIRVTYFNVLNETYTKQKSRL